MSTPAIVSEPPIALAPVVAIGGIGGSGTRVGAALLRMLGYYIGDDLNEQLDNLWFTLLFKRRAVLLENQDDFRLLANIFFSRMEGLTQIGDDARHLLSRLSAQDRLQHPMQWLAQRVETFCNGVTLRGHNQPWGWKEPNTLIVIDRLLGVRPDLRYIHFVRHPIDMALSSNQNQPQLWGPIVLERDVRRSPADSLAYWCAIDRRMQALQQRWPETILEIDYDALCLSPRALCLRVAAFLRMTVASEVEQQFDRLVGEGRPDGHRYAKSDLAQFEEGDLRYVERRGFQISP